MRTKTHGFGRAVMIKRKTSTALVTFLALCPFASWATPTLTMTFNDGAGVLYEGTYIENGIFAQTDGEFPLSLSGGQVHLDRRGTGWPSNIIFTTGGLFITESVMIWPSGSGYSDPAVSTECCTPRNDPIPYIWFTGSVNDVVVATLGVFRPVGSGYELFSLASFGAIDTLRIEPKNYFDLGLTGTCDHEQGCGHFGIDNLMLRPVQTVPEPSTIALLGLGLAGIAFARRKQRTAAH